MKPTVERFLRRFETFGDAPSVPNYLALFHPEATLFDAGMDRPITVPEIPEHFETILKLVPDFQMVPERFREREGTVFVEARNRATVGPKAAEWRSIYCVDLEGDRVIRGRRYYDRRALFAHLNPAIPALPMHAPTVAGEPESQEPFEGPEALVRSLGEAFESGDRREFAQLFRADGTFFGPDMERPLSRAELGPYHTALRALLADVRMELVQWAGDETLVFAEWEIHARLGDTPVLIRAADRFDCAAGYILAGRAYFDTLELAARIAALAPEGAVVEANS